MKLSDWREFFELTFCQLGFALTFTMIYDELRWSFTIYFLLKPKSKITRNY